LPGSSAGGRGVYRQVLEEGRLYQTIVTTGFHSPNAAAMGITRIGSEIMIRVFEGSDTYRNLGLDTRFVIHLVPLERELLVVEAALRGWGTGKPEFEFDRFDSFHGILYLVDVGDRIFCRAKKRKDIVVEDEVGSSAALEAAGEVFRDETRDGIRPIAHKDSPLVEAAVWATRWKAADKDRRGPLQDRVFQYLDEAEGVSDPGGIELVKRFMEGA